MSDLAPLVAATIRDRTFLNLQEENTQLRRENRDKAREVGLFTHGGVRLTGSYGFPLYAVAFRDNGDGATSATTAQVEENQEEGVRTHTLAFKEDDDDVIDNHHKPLRLSRSELKSLEVHVGTEKVPDTLGAWDVSVPAARREEADGSVVYEFRMRHWHSQFRFPEMTIEVGYDQDPGHLLNLPWGIDSLYENRTHEPLSPTIRFLNIRLNEPLILDQ